MDKIIAAVTGAFGIIGTYWFFFMKKDSAVSVTDSVEIVVEGGYSPSTISIVKGKTTKLHFFRKDASSCLEEIVIPDFKIKKYLPLNKTTTIEIKPETAGEFSMSCGMNMFHGKIIVS